MNDSIRTTKKALRQELRARILALTTSERQSQETALNQRFPSLPGLSKAQVVLAYLSAFPEETHTWEMARSVLNSGQRLILPRVDIPEKRLRLHEVTDLDHSLVTNRWGIAEPHPHLPEIEANLIDWALIPGLGFNTNRFRLGRGAGHYDRLLTTMRSDAPRISLIFDCQWVDNLPLEPHDQPLDAVVSPHQSVFSELLE